MPPRQPLRSIGLLLVSVVLFSLSGRPEAQEQIGVRQAGAGRLRGRVVNAQTGLPVRDVSVLAVTAGSRETQRGARTDGNGQFEITELPAGHYIVTASRVGYVSISYGQRRALEAPRPLALADKEVLDTIDFRLPRGGAIVGRVLDEFGEPFPDARVQATRLRFVNGQRRAAAVGDGFQTDDLGRFRIYDLPPGDYYVSASVQTPPNMVAGVPTYARTVLSRHPLTQRRPDRDRGSQSGNERYRAFIASAAHCQNHRRRSRLDRSTPAIRHRCRGAIPGR